MSNLAKIDKEYVVAEVSSFLRYFDKEIGWDTSRNLYTGEIFGPFLSFDIRKVAAFVVNNMELCRDLTPVDLSSLFKMFKGTEYEFLIFEIIKSIDNGSSDMESVSQLIIETIRGCDLTEEEWAEIISRYKDHKVSTYPFPGDLGTIYIFPQDFKEEYHETIDKLNRLILNYSPFLSEIRESEFKDLDDIFRLAKKYNLKIPYKDKDLSYDDLIGTFVFLIDSNGFGTRFFDVQIAPEVFSSPLYRMIRLLRSAPESIKLEYGNLRLWRGLLESNDKQLFLEHYGKYLWKNDMTYLKKWKDINRELTNILGDKVAGETDPEFIWAEFRKEFSHNAIGILFMIGIFSFILSYGADRLRRRDIILKGSAEKVIGKILKKNTWFKGKRADTARALMKELSKPRGKELDHKQRAQLEILRLSLPGKQRVLFDIMCCLAIETPDKVKGLSARMLNLIPLVTVAALFDTPEHKARQAMNKELLDLALSVLVKGVELGKIYDRLREILDKYSIRSLDTVESRGTNINHYDELQKRILMEFNRNMSLRVAPSDRYFPGPNGVSIPRAGQGSEFFEFGEYAPGQRIAWKQSARSDRLVSLIAETDKNERGNILINMRTLFDPDYADIWIKDFVKSMVVMFDERRVHGRKTHALNDLIFIMPDGSIESVKIRKGKGHDIKSGGMKKVISEFQKRYETAQACLARGRLYFYSEGQNRRYLQRASESINGGGNIAESIRKNVQAKELRGQDVFCVGIKDKEDASTHDILTQDASLIMNKYKARALFWSRNTAGPFRRKAVKQPTRPVSKKLGKQIIKPDHQKIKGSDERWNPPVHKNQHRTFRFPDYIWQEFKTLLNANAGEDVYNIVKNRGLSWIDPEGNRHWIDELDGLDAGTLKVIWTAAKNAVNIANGKNPQDNGYVKDTQAIKDVIAYHEDIHALFRDQKYKELISHFRQKLEEKLGPLHESHPFIKAFSKTYGRPHAGEFPEGESRVTSNERRIDWYLEEFLTLSIQEHNLFHDKYFVLNKMIEMADKKDKTVLSRNKDIIRNALDAILEDHLIKYEIEKRQEPPSYLQYGHEYETRRGLDDLQKLYPGLENILGDLPEGADVLVIGPGAGFEILDMKKDYSHLNFQSIDRENIFELEGIRIDIQNRYSISDDAEAEEKLDYLKRHFLEHDVEKGLVGKGLYEENMFDAVIVGSWVMKHIKNKPALIEEIHKVLKVGGVGLTELIDMQIAAKNNLLGVKPPKTLMEQAEKLKQVIRFFNKPEISRGELRAEARLFGHSRDTNIVDLASLTIKKTSTRKLSIPLRLHDPENGIYVVDRRGGSSVSSAEKTDPFIKHKKEILDKRGTLDAEKHLKLYGPESNSILDKEGRKDLLERLKKYSRILGQHIFLSEETHAEGMQYISVEKGRPGTYRFILNRIPSGLKKNARFCVPGYSYDLRVKGVQGTVLMLEDAIGDSVPFPRSGELVFRGEDTTYFAQKEVVDELIRNLSSNGSDTTGYKAIDRLLRLSRDDVPTSSEKLREKIDYLDKEISRIKIITEEGEEIWKGDESQDMAVRLALSGSRQTVIHGSPGTGKTKTIVAIIRQYVRRGKKVLLVSQQNQAVDQALARVMDHVPSLRLSNEAKEEMKKYGTDRIWSGNTVARNRFERDIRGNNTGYLIASTNISLVTDKFYGKNNLKGRDFDVVIMDESSRTQLTEALVPMRYLKSDGKLIVVGDAKQLKPHRDMDIEKRFRMNGKTGVTKKDLDGFYGSVLDEMEGTGIADEVMLSTNWRSRPLLAKLVSEVFYNSEVNLRGWEEFTPATLNLKLIDTDWDKKLVFEESGNEFGRNGTSLMNRRSATMVTNMVKTYMEKPETKAEDITIITFYEAQKVMIETLLENLYPDGKRTRVFTVDSYQGGENKTIIIDFVRSNLKGKIGFMRDMNRLRVAMSRAEEHLGLVMDSRVFMEDPETIDEEDKEVRDALKKINEFYEREVLSVFPDAEFRKYKTNGNGSEELEEEDQEVPDDMEDAIEEDDIETSVPSDLIAGRYKVLGEIEYVNGKIVFLAEDTKKDVKIFIELPARKAENGEFKKGSLISEIHNITKDILDVIPKGNRFLLEPNEYGILKIIRGDILAVVDPSAGEEKGKKTNPKKKKAVGGKEIGIKFGDKRRVREEWARGKNKGFMGKFEEVKDESGIVIKPVVISGDNGKLEGIVRNLDTGVEFDLAEMEQEVISGSEDVRRYSEEKAARIKELLEDVMPVDSEKRFIEEILDNFLCNNLPDNIILTKGGVQGFFGIAIEGHAGSHFDIKRRKVLAIDTDLADKNPISFLHEVMEYFKYIAQEDEYEGYITAIYKLLEDVDLLKSAEVNKFSGRTWFEAHEFKYRTQGRRDYFSENRAHYLIRAFTRQVFKEHDFELTQVITATGMYETAQELVPAVVKMMRKAPIYAIEPAASLESVSPVIDYLRQTERSLDKGGHNIHARSYLADEGWVWNIRQELGKVIPDFYTDVTSFEGKNRDENKTRMVIRLKSSDEKDPVCEEAVIRTFIIARLIECISKDNKDLSDEEKENIAEEIINKKVRFIAAYFGNTERLNTVIDLFTDITVVECDRYGRDSHGNFKKDGYSEEVPEHLAERLLCLLRSSITNYDEIIRKAGGEDIPEILKALFSGSVMRIRSVDWGTIADWKRSWDAVLKSL
ncbi:MAG: AAA family ATPase [Candidatus Omnitrophica bacterium]|nr:AAA family ATPase [Candidatus Omnitrophota bacterium]